MATVIELNTINTSPMSLSLNLITETSDGQSPLLFLSETQKYTKSKILNFRIMKNKSNPISYYIINNCDTKNDIQNNGGQM